MDRQASDQTEDGPRQRAVRELFERRHLLVLRVCRRILGDRAAAEDAAVETFLNALRYIANNPDFKARNEEAWLRTIAKRVSLNSRRAMLGKASLPLTLNMADSRQPSAETQRLLAQLLEKLDHRLRASFKLHLEGYSNREIAQLVGLSESAIQQQIAKVRKTLQDELTGGAFVDQGESNA